MTAMRLPSSTRHASIPTPAGPFGPHRLVLRPREGHDLASRGCAWRSTPEHRLHWIRDVFGNSIALVDLLEAAELAIVSDVVVERAVRFRAETLHEPWRVPFPRRYDPLETAIARVYSAPSYPADEAAVRPWLGLAARSRSRTTRKATMLALCTRVFATVKLSAPRGEGRADARADARARQRLVPRHGDAADGCGARARLRRPLRQRLSGLPRIDGRARRRPMPGPRSICRRSAGAASIRRSASRRRPAHRDRRSNIRAASCRSPECSTARPPTI